MDSDDECLTENDVYRRLRQIDDEMAAAATRIAQIDAERQHHENHIRRLSANMTYTFNTIKIVEGSKFRRSTEHFEPVEWLPGQPWIRARSKTILPFHCLPNHENLMKLAAGILYFVFL